MRILLLLACFLFAILTAQAQIHRDTTYATNIQPLACGQTVQGSFVGATNQLDHWFNPDSAFYQNSFDTGMVDRTYRFTLSAASYVRILRNDTNDVYYKLTLCKDSSNATVLQLLRTCISTYLPAGTYYVTIEEKYPADYSLELVCSPTPISLQPLLDSLAMPGTINGTITGSLAGAPRNLFAYGAGYFPGPERVYRLDLPVESYMYIDALHSIDRGTLLLDSVGNPLNIFGYPNRDTAHIYPAGTYYISVEQSYYIGADFTIEIFSQPVAPACPFTNSTPRPGIYGGALSSTVNGAYCLYYSNSYPPPSIYYTLFADQYVTTTQYLRVGGVNSITVSLPVSLPWYAVYVDLNRDGDFEDAGELIHGNLVSAAGFVTQQFGDIGDRINPEITENFTLDSANAIYASAIGHAFRMRVIVSDTNLITPCHLSSYGQAIDTRVVFEAATLGMGDIGWLQTASDAGSVSYTKLLAAPGGFFAAGTVAVPFYENPPPSTHYPTANSYLALGDSIGKPKIYALLSAHHFVVGTFAFLASYSNEGGLKWIKTVIGGGYDHQGNAQILDIATTPDSGVILSAYYDTPTAGPYYGMLRYNSRGGWSSSSNLNYYYFGQQTYPYVALYNLCSGLDGSIAQSYYWPWYYNDTTSYLIYGSDSIKVSKKKVVLTNSTPLGHPWIVQGLTNPQDFGVNTSVGSKIIYDRQGNLYWKARFHTDAGLISLSDSSTLAVDTANSGQTHIVCVSPTGHLRWLRPLPRVAITAMAAAPDSGITLGGAFTGAATLDSITYQSNGYADAIVLQLTPGGHVSWASTAGGAGPDTVTSLTYTSNGLAHVLLHYGNRIDSAFGSGFLPAPSGRAAAIFTLNPADGRAIDSSGFFSLGGQTAVSINAIAGGPGNQVAMAGSFQGETFFAGRGSYIPNGQDGFLLTSSLTARLPHDSVRVITALPALAKNGLLLYPNPAPGGELTVRYAQANGGADKLVIFNAQGQMVYSQSVTGMELTAGIRLNTRLAAGLYTVRCQGTSGRVVVP